MSLISGFIVIENLLQYYSITAQIVSSQSGILTGSISVPSKENLRFLCDYINMDTEKSKQNLLEQIKTLLINARTHAIRAVNTTMVRTYFEIGRLIVENEQEGKERAKYGGETLRNLSKGLTKEFGKGFSVQNLDRMRVFYKTYSIFSTVSRKFKKGQTLSVQFEQPEKSSTVSRISEKTKITEVSERSQTLSGKSTSYQTSA
jgi:hypothetical protein